MKSTSRRRVSIHERREESDIATISLSAPGIRAPQIPQAPPEDRADGQEQEPGVLGEVRAPQCDRDGHCKYRDADQRGDDRPLPLPPARGLADEEPRLQSERKAQQAE